ncbi:hypothetical protein C8T65DRAFT_583633 [Cerioporus squamosus]|nr:hypothetical protein C8T65DRAFT_583633 [Cerioporus squamosus]
MCLRGQAAGRYAPYGPSPPSRPSGSSSHSSRPSGSSSRPSCSSQSSSTAALSALALPTTKPGQDLRDICQQMIGFNFPGFRPRNDFELITLATTKYPGTRANLGTWLDEQLAFAIQEVGSLEAVMDYARTSLGMPSNRITGLKPGPTERNVFLRPIPNSPYSIRLFPGCVLAREYCLDFVDTRTGLPVNSPFKFELLAVPNRSGPSSALGLTRITNLDSAFGVRPDEILPGHEKFLLRDGQTCLLRRPGHKDVRFTVPTRRQPTAGSQAPDDVHDLDLPESIEA